MAKRLVKVASELNVGTGTIVDHLLKNGFSLEDNPRAKISDEMYSNLLEAFSNSVAIKEQADQLNIGNTRKKEVEADTAVIEPPVEPTPPKVDVPQPEPTIPTPEPEEITPPEYLEISPEPIEEPAPEPTPEPAIHEPEPVIEEKQTPTTQVEATPEVPEAPIEKEAPQPTEKEAPTKDSTKLDGLKVLGKIDPNTLKNAGKKKKKKAAPKAKKETPKPVTKETPPPPKPKEETLAPKPAPIKGETKSDPPAKPTRPEEQEIFRAETPTLKGVKILGKIDPAKLKKSQPAKKKTTTDKNKTSNAEGDKKRRRRRKKVATGERRSEGARGNAGGNNRRNDNRRGNNKGNNTPREISKKEVDDKLKETMARLQGGGKNRRQKIRREERSKRREKQELIDLENQETGVIQVTEFIPVSELASLMNVSATDVIMACMNMGVIVAINQRLDAEIIELVAEEFGHQVEFISAEAQMEMEEEEIEDAPEDLKPRAPIVTVMGHVDHGKTSLLDYIRSAKVMEGEAGGITQHIGAYEVKVGDDDRKVTFLDTPGHEAFTAMRARGAKVTDVAVIIVAADDNVMPQTKEAISHAQAAGVPIVFAINKIDKDGSNPERIKQELATMNILVDDWGGKFPSQEISAKHGDGVDDLLEKITLEADILELQANPDREAQGVVLEASLDKGRGYISKFLIQHGTLKIGDAIVAGAHFGKVRAMVNERGQRIKTAGPSSPVLVLGMKGAPQAGEKFKVMTSESDARQLAAKRGQIQNEQERRATKRLSLEEIGRRLALGSFKELNLIVKGDVDGSIEALADSLLKLSTDTVQVNIVHKAVGQIIESDILLASASDAIIVGFQVRPSAIARRLAEREGVQIKTYSVIYDAIEEIKSAIEGMLEPTKEEKVQGTIEVREVFKISKVGTIAGCYVQEGKIFRNSHIRVIRDGIVIYPLKEGVVGELASLKRYKDDVKEVTTKMECGMNIKNFNDIKVGDTIEAYEIVEVKQKLK